MSFVQDTGEGTFAIGPGDVTFEGYVASFETVQLWSDEERAAWGIRRVEPTLDDLKAAKSAQVTDRREAVFAAGYSPASGALTGHTLQVRNEADKINWLTSQASYLAAIQGGHGAVQGATFRTAANDTVITSFAEGFQIIVVGMAQWGAAIMNRSWVLKDEIAAATDTTALAAIDIEVGWP